MTRTIRAAAFAAAALLGPHAALAQDLPVVSLSPADRATWDLAGTPGYYLTSHFKTELQVTASRQGRIFSQESIPVPVRLSL